MMKFKDIPFEIIGDYLLPSLTWIDIASLTIATQYSKRKREIVYKWLHQTVIWSNSTGIASDADHFETDFQQYPLLGITKNQQEWLRENHMMSDQRALFYQFQLDIEHLVATEYPFEYLSETLWSQISRGVKLSEVTKETYNSGRRLGARIINEISQEGSNTSTMMPKKPWTLGTFSPWTKQKRKSGLNCLHAQDMPLIEKQRLAWCLNDGRTLCHDTLTNFNLLRGSHILGAWARNIHYLILELMSCFNQNQRNNNISALVLTPRTIVNRFNMHSKLSRARPTNIKLPPCYQDLCNIMVIYDQLQTTKGWNRGQISNVPNYEKGRHNILSLRNNAEAIKTKELRIRRKNITYHDAMFSCNKCKTYYQNPAMYRDLNKQLKKIGCGVIANLRNQREQKLQRIRTFNQHWFDSTLKKIANLTSESHIHKEGNYWLSLELNSPVNKGLQCLFNSPRAIINGTLLHMTGVHLMPRNLEYYLLEIIVVNSPNWFQREQPGKWQIGGTLSYKKEFSLLLERAKKGSPKGKHVGWHLHLHPVFEKCQYNRIWDHNKWVEFLHHQNVEITQVEQYQTKNAHTYDANGLPQLRIIYLTETLNNQEKGRLWWKIFDQPREKALTSHPVVDILTKAFDLDTYKGDRKISRFYEYKNTQATMTKNSRLCWKESEMNEKPSIRSYYQQI